MWGRNRHSGLRACALLFAGLSIALLMAAPGASAATQYWLKGRAWGHGIGMSQYGAQGFARRGYTASQIIRYYYTGATMGTRPADAEYVTVQLTSGRPGVTFEADAAGVKVTNGGVTKAVDNGDFIVARVEGSNVGVFVRDSSGERRLFGGDAQVTTITGPSGSLQTRFQAESGFWGRHYRGSLRIHKVGGSLSVINRVSLEQYLWGVVPAEMPTSWHAEALKAQSIAARSYAIRGRCTSCLYDLHSDTRSQMYGGVEEEEAPSTSAVNATAGQVGMYGGNVIQAFFFSTSGGRTADNEDVWQAGAPVPYLRSKSDPYEVSPYGRWPIQVYSPSGLARRLGVSGSVTGMSVSVNNSLRAQSVRVRHGGTSTTLSPTTVQVRLGLRSTWFRFEKLRIVANDYSVRAGARVRLAGTVPRSGATELWYRNTDGGTWTRLVQLSPDSNGSWVRYVRTSVDRTYRLRRGGRFGPQVRINVS